MIGNITSQLLQIVEYNENARTDLHRRISVDIENSCGSESADGCICNPQTLKPHSFIVSHWHYTYNASVNLSKSNGSKGKKLPTLSKHTQRLR